MNKDLNISNNQPLLFTEDDLRSFSAMKKLTSSVDFSDNATITEFKKWKQLQTEAEEHITKCEAAMRTLKENEHSNDVAITLTIGNHQPIALCRNWSVGLYHILMGDQAEAIKATKNLPNEFQ